MQCSPWWSVELSVHWSQGPRAANGGLITAVCLVPLEHRPGIGIKLRPGLRRHSVSEGSTGKAKVLSLHGFPFLTPWAILRWWRVYEDIFFTMEVTCHLKDWGHRVKCSVFMTENLSAKVPDTQEGMAAGLKDLKRHEESERHGPVAYLEKNDLCFVWGPVILMINFITTGVGWRENVGLKRT